MKVQESKTKRPAQRNVFLNFLFVILCLITSHSLNAQTSKESPVQLLDSNRFEEVVSMNKNLCSEKCGNSESKELITQMGAENVGDPCNQLGVAYMGMNYFKPAIAAFKEAILCDDSGRYHSNLALAYVYDKDYQSAEIHYKKAIDLLPRNSNEFSSKINYSILLIKKKEYSKAEMFLREAVENKAHLFYTYLYLGYTLYQQKKYTEALSFYDRGIKMNPNYADLYIYRAYVYFQLNNLSGADLDLNQAEILSSETINPRIHQLRNIIRTRIQGNK
ncbi:tetratricopeptide repeat protein [Leptospira sp. 201903071]|uniref:tetratricopeptide repeat protein n=1 Tax=Leptospira ainazelensis TaxID=2810034 RepID=UPI00196479E6|nr:tetratricopeptide repeat protein [Leptospira ainazelensis]MBM9499011.1 tetratricopeptide repeat protein [Leptospira ainazelensis]